MSLDELMAKLEKFRQEARAAAEEETAPPPTRVIPLLKDGRQTVALVVSLQKVGVTITSN